MSISSTNDHISLNLGVDNLADNVSVSDSNTESVFWRVVFVFGLDNQSLTGIVVGLIFTSTAVFGLVTFIVGLVLYNLNEWLAKLVRCLMKFERWMDGLDW